MECEICGKSDGRMYGKRNKFGKVLCSRHYAQMSNHGEIFSKTVRDKNDIEIKDDFAVIKVFRKGNIYEALIDIEDVEFVSKYKWSIDGNGYLVANALKYKTLHTILVEAGVGEVVDHLNQNRLDNRKENLRVATISLNAINSKMNSNNKTGFKGVFYYERYKKYQAYLTINNKRVYFGMYEDINDAIVARLKGELEYFGENSPQKHLFKEYGIEVDA